jgi:hypothetical protein
MTAIIACFVIVVAVLLRKITHKSHPAHTLAGLEVPSNFSIALKWIRQPAVWYVFQHPNFSYIREEGIEKNYLRFGYAFKHPTHKPISYNDL